MSHGTRDIKYYNTLNVMTQSICAKKFSQIQTQSAINHTYTYAWNYKRIQTQLQTHRNVSTQTRSITHPQTFF